jgi:hypothetical protein
MNCNACNKVLNIKEAMKCHLCVGKYHYQCFNIERNKYMSFSKEQTSKWICPTCSNITRRARSNDNTPVRRNNLVTDDNNESLNMSCDVANESSTTSFQSPAQASDLSIVDIAGGGEVTMDKISIFLDQKLNSTLSIFMHTFRKALRDDVREMVQSEMAGAMKDIKEEFSATTDYICAEQTQLRLEMSDVASTIKLLESENLKLQTEIHRLNTRILGMEKISRNCNIELQAVPERRNENVLLLFKKLCEVVKAPLADENISSCRRVAKLNPSTNRPRNIVITLSTPRLRDLVLSATHRYNKTHSERGLTSFDLGVPGEACKIYVTAVE